MAKQRTKAIKSVLVVEDDKSIQSALQDLLESEGYAVSCAANGQKALSFLRSTQSLPGVILLNLMMPVMDGFQFRTEQERDARLAGIPVVIMTADRYIESKKMKFGARAYIKKPLDIDDVVKKIEPYF